MYLTSLLIESFRNISQQQLNFIKGKNYFFGDNAQGKTNFLEAIYLLCLCKSFRANSDQEMIPLGENRCAVSGIFSDSSSIEHEVKFVFSNTDGKKITLDGKAVHQYSSLIGQFPVVVLSVADYDITHGPPQQRRRFINILSSQCSPRYLNDLKDYERIVKQRNTILSAFQTGKRSSESEMDVWNEQLVEKGSSLIAFRRQLIEDLNNLVQQFYLTIAWGTQDHFYIVYQPRIDVDQSSEIKEQFWAALHRVKALEKIRGMTLVGPHRDEFQFMIGDRPLRTFGSRGEHKSVLVSLKAAEAFLLKRRLQSSPLLLLDDLYAELDRIRGEKVLELFTDGGQSFITGTSFDYAALQTTEAMQNQEKLFFVTSGKFVEKENGS